MMNQLLLSDVEIVFRNPNAKYIWRNIPSKWKNSEKAQDLAKIAWRNKFYNFNIVDIKVSFRLEVIRKNMPESILKDYFEFIKDVQFYAGLSHVDNIDCVKEIALKKILSQYPNVNIKNICFSIDEFREDLKNMIHPIAM